MSTDPHPSPERRRLESWKEIAAYLNRSVRCAQLWERDEGLPVHRLEHDKRSTVYADTAELDAWCRSREASLEQTPPATPQATAARRIRPALIGAAVVTVIAFAAALIASRWHDNQPSRDSLEFVPLTTYRGVEQSPSLSPDGSQVAFAWNGENEDNYDIYIKVVGTGPAVRLTRGSWVEVAPSWSPDGRWLAFYRMVHRSVFGPAEVVVIPALGGPERIVGTASILCGIYSRPVWSADSTRLIFPSRSEPTDGIALHTVEIETANTRQLTRPGASTNGDAAAAVSPDGATLAFVRHRSSSGADVLVQGLTPDLRVLDDPKQLNRVPDAFTEIAWSADGKSVLAATMARGVWSLPATGSEAPVALPGTEGAIQLSVNLPSGRLAIARPVWDPDLLKVDLETGTVKPFCPSTRTDYGAVISPDGRHVAFQSARSGQFEIWLCDNSGENPRQLTSMNTFAGTPRWSPDGSHIAFDSKNSGKFSIWVVPLAGGAPKRLTHDESSNQYIPSWSRDGKWIYFGSGTTVNARIWKIPSEGGEAKLVTTGFAAMESVDGKTLYFAGRGGIWKTPVDGGLEEFLVGDVHDAHSFDVLEDGIYFISSDRTGNLPEVRRYRFSNQRVERVVQIEGDLQMGLTVSRDRKSLIYSAYVYRSGDLEFARLL